jgi:hypothetical protein
MFQQKRIIIIVVLIVIKLIQKRRNAVEGIDAKLQLLAKKLGIEIKPDEFANVIIPNPTEKRPFGFLHYSLEEFMYNLLVYTNYVASFEDVSEDVQVKTFLEFINSSDYETDYNELTNYIIDTLLTEEDDVQ